LLSTVVLALALAQAHQPTVVPLGKVWVPVRKAYRERPNGIAWKELIRLQPGADLTGYEGQPVDLGPGDVVVVFGERYPGPGQSPLADVWLEKRTVFLFLGDIEDHLGLARGDPVFKIAVGRTIAHELEHIRRNSHDHDPDGFFARCLGRKEMLELGWGRPSVVDK
jgi:hypothetical protein